MAYFPFFIDIKDKPFLVVGGGNVALRKVRKLLPFEPKITLCAPEICEEILDIDGIIIKRRKFEERDLEGVFAVISATSDEQLNSRIYEICKEKNILVNTVDVPDKCGFIFPAIVKKNDISVGISTGGKSPLYAKYLRKKLDRLITEEDANAIEFLGEIRPCIKAEIADEEKRKAAFERVLQLCIDSGKPPEKAEINRIIQEYKSK